MPKFPYPPAPQVLARIPPALRVLPSSSELWRIYFRGGDHPTFWDTFRAYGPTNSRFDHHFPPPSVQQRMVVYLAAEGITCLAEVFQDTRVIDRSARQPWLVGFALAQDLSLLDLTGTWPTRAGASMVIGSGPKHRARRWSQAIYEAYPHVHGLLYASSMCANRPSVALYERGIPAIPTTPIFHRPLNDPALLTPLRNAAVDLGYRLV